MDLQLKGKTALVTGGSEGIGKGIALAARQGRRRRRDLRAPQGAAGSRRRRNRQGDRPQDRRHPGRPAQGRRRQELHRAGPQGARPRRHHGQQRRLGGGRRDRAPDRGRLGEGPAAQVHGLRALPALRAADHGQAGRRPRREPDRQRRREAVLLGNLPGRRQRGGPEPHDVARRTIRQARHQLLRGQSRPGAHRALGRASCRRCRAT